MAQHVTITTQDLNRSQRRALRTVEKKKPTDEQWKAICSKQKFMLVIAGPGTGKTFTLAHRIRYIIRKRGVSGKRILAFTFSNRATGEMEAKIAELCPGLELPWLGTSHAICCRILEAAGIDFTICDEPQQRALVDAIVKEIEGVDADDADAVAYITWYKTHSHIPTAISKWPEDRLPMLHKVYKRYQKELHSAGQKDFTDLLRDTIALFERKPKLLRRYQMKFQHIIADELQDFTPLQFKLMTLLKSDSNTLWCVGDDDQVIYSWLGANPKLMMGLWDNPGVKKVLLTKNFRSCSHIVEGSSELIVHNDSRIPKENSATRGIGSRIKLRPAESTNDLAQAIADSIRAILRQGYSPSDIAILGRRRICWQHVHKVLEESGIPCIPDNAPNLYGTKNAQALLNYLKVIAAPADDSALEAIINYPPRCIGEETVNEIKANAERCQCSYTKAIRKIIKKGNARDSLIDFSDMMKGWRKLAKEKPAKIVVKDVIEQSGLDKDDLQPLRDKIASYPTIKAFLNDFRPYSHHYANFPQPDAVRLMTIHGAKGAEFKAVFLVGWEHGVLPDERAFKDKADMEEERRLAYVAMTRAMDRLYIHYVKDSRYFTEQVESYPSRFLLEMSPDLIKMLQDDEKLAVPLAERNEQNINDYVCGETLFHQGYKYGKIKSLISTHATVIFNTVGKKRILLSDNSLKKTWTR